MKFTHRILFLLAFFLFLISSDLTADPLYFDEKNPSNLSRSKLIYDGYFQSFEDKIEEEKLPFYDEVCYCPTLGVFIPYLQYRGGDGRSYQHGYESIGAFLALYHQHNLNYPFLDFKFHRVDQGRLAANVGVGYRVFSPDFREMIGANIYYDYRRFSPGNLHQIGLGVELLGRCWDIRGNGYIPVGNNRAFRDTTLFTYPGDFFAIRDRFESAMWGVDVEIGRCLYSNRCVAIYGALGPYFYGSECCNSLVGAMGRVRAKFCRYLTLQFYVTYDDFFHTKLQGEILLSFPLPCSIDCLKCLFMPVERNEIIVTEEVCCWQTNF